jgi:hypothetical protein
VGRPQTFGVVCDLDLGDGIVERSNSRVSMAGSGDAGWLEQDSHYRLYIFDFGLLAGESTRMTTRGQGRRSDGDHQKAQETTLPTLPMPRALGSSTSERCPGAMRSERAIVANLCEEKQPTGAA